MTTPSEVHQSEIIRTVATAIQDSNRLLKLLLQQTHQQLVEHNPEDKRPNGTTAQSLREQAQHLLEQYQDEWVQSFARYLLEECTQPRNASSSQVSGHAFNGDLDTLDWGDGQSIQAQAEFAEWHKRLEASLQKPLLDLHRIIAAAQGQSIWHSTHNPLHPRHYLRSLEKMVCQTQAHISVCQYLLRLMYAHLTPLLEQTYRSAVTQLSESGAYEVILESAQAARPHRRSTPSTRQWSKTLLAEYLNRPHPPVVNASVPSAVATPAAHPAIIPSDTSSKPTPPPRQPRHEPHAKTPADSTPSPKASHAELPDTLRMGAWFRIGTGSRAVLSRLSWNSHDRSVFLFTSADGRSQTMTRRRLLHLLQNDEIQPSAAP